MMPSPAPGRLPRGLLPRVLLPGAALVLLPLLPACAGAGADRCAALSLDACAIDDACAIVDASDVAPPGIEDTATCWTIVGSRSVACGLAGATCGDPVFASDPADGSCWLFEGGCVPAHWGTCADAPSGGVCE